MNIEFFEITGLFGKIDYQLRFDDNRLILIGENGAGKSTIMKIFYYVLSTNFTKLMTYNFVSIRLSIDNNIFEFSRNELAPFDLLNRPELRHIPVSIRNRIKEMYSSNNPPDPIEIRRICMHFGIPSDIFLGSQFSIEDTHIGRKNKNLSNKIAELRNIIEKIKILYLPTYRRIEQNLSVVLAEKLTEEDINRISPRRYRRFSNPAPEEIIEFGMEDVQQLISYNADELVDFFRAELNKLSLDYLNDIVTKNYNEKEINIVKKWDDNIFEKVISRVDNSILPEKTVNKLYETLLTLKSENSIKGEQSSFICHYLTMLLKIVETTEKKESNLRNFIEISNKYLQNKVFKYDPINFNFTIHSNLTDSDDIKLNQLSSGEKQVISLICKMYLENINEYFIIIDEPELSLSVEWQRHFLEDISKGNFCKGLFAVTHSPFIFDNSLDKYAHGMEEFRRQ